MSGLGAPPAQHHPVAATRKPERPHETEPRMTLADKLGEAPKRTAGLPCSVGALEDRLEGAEAAALQAMLHTLGWSGRRVYDTLAAEGYEVGQQTVNRHRSRACRCYQGQASA